MTSHPANGESRAYLQERTEVFARFMFWAFVALRVFERVLYAAYPEVTPDHYLAIVLIGLAGLGAFAISWRAR